MRRTFLLVLMLALAAYVVSPLPGSSKPLPERIADKRSRVERAERREGVLTTDISGATNRIIALQGDIKVTQGRLVRAQQGLDRKLAELFELRQQLERARDRLARLREQLVVAQRALRVRLIEMYKADQPDLLTVVLSADGFNDLLERVEFLDRVSAQDREVFERVRTLKAAARRETDQLARLEDGLERAATALLEQRNQIAASKVRLRSTRTDLRRAVQGQRQTLARVRNNKSRAKESLQALEVEQAEVARRLRAAANASEPTAAAPPTPSAPPGAVRPGSGRFIWPINGPLTSPFGQRWGRLHAGIDISAPDGTPIRAADSGQVVLAGWQGGYGNYTCIQHGGGISTCYAHQSRLGTSQGASVRQGQVMGYVGNTGHSFGAHLHFEVRVGGSPVDPMGYL